MHRFIWTYTRRSIYNNVISVLLFSAFVYSVGPIVLRGQHEHPKEDLVPYFNKAHNISSNTISEKEKRKLKINKKRINKAKRIRTIGSKDGDIEYIIGSVRDVDVYKNHVIVLDDESKKIRVYRVNDGKHVDTIGRQGSGPGEFSTPNDVFVNQNGDIWVADSDQSVLRFAYKDTAYVYQYSFDTGENPEYICGNGDDIFTYGLGTPKGEDIASIKPIHRYSLKGAHKESFGPIYNSKNVIVSVSMSEASDLQCFSDKLVVQYRYLPVMLSIAKDSGDINWVTKFNHKTVRAKSFNMNGRQAIKMGKPEYGTYMGKEITKYNGFIVSQFYILEKSGIKYRSYLMDVETGRGIIINDSESIWLYTSNNVSVSTSSSMVPKIVLFNI